MAIIPKNYARLESGYREKALKIYPWVCGRCSREFVYSNLRELTVHHIDHDHTCLLYTSPSPRDRQKSRMPSSA